MIQSASSSSRTRDITHPLLLPQRKGGEERKKKLRMNLNICTPSINSDFDYSSVPAVITRPLSGFRVDPSLLGLEIRRGEKNMSQVEQDAVFASPLCS